MSPDQPNWPELRSPRDVRRIEQAARVAWLAAREAVRAARAGMTTAELDGIVRSVISRHGGRPAFEHLESDDASAPFRGAACICVNEQALHAPPGERVLAGGDLVTVDVGVVLGGWYGDVAESGIVPGGLSSAAALLRAARATVAAGVRACGPGVRWSEVARAVRSAAARHDLTVLTGFTGHGVGRRLHEPPTAGYETRPGGADDFVLLPGMVLTIEPILAGFPGKVQIEPDGWTVSTADGSPACHVERMVHVTRTGRSVLGRASSGRDAREGL
ncbi:MAG: type I methionyl aminopeptidase [Phycisphaerales bacterium JB054]